MSHQSSVSAETYHGMVFFHARPLVLLPAFFIIIVFLSDSFQ
jgi:hypothetical protein